MAKSTKTERAASTPMQMELFRARGGFRKRAGRKRAGPFKRTAHTKRCRLTRHKPLLVTTHLVAGLPNLRNEKTLATLRRVLSAGSDRFGFRLVEFGIQTNHLHLIAEADDALAFSRGMRGLLVRVARALNAEWGRTGQVLRDRYHARVQKCGRDARFALIYVLQNAKKHGAKFLGVDHYSSGPWFEGWSDRAAKVGRPIARGKSWVLTIGWKRSGLVSTSDAPAGARHRDWAEFLELDGA